MSERYENDLWKEPAEIIGIAGRGVSCGLSQKRTEPGFVLDNGTALLESETDENGFYIGGTGMDGMYLRTSERYAPVRDERGKLTGFRRVSKYVSAFTADELRLIYMYALNTKENLLEDLAMARRQLANRRGPNCRPDIDGHFASAAEKLAELPEAECRRLMADVYAAFQERHQQALRARQRAAQRER